MKDEQAHAQVPGLSDRDARADLIGDQAAALAGLQHEDGHIVFELEADCTIPAEYVLMCHFLGEIDAAREARLASYLRGVQNADGSWPLFHDGPGNISATVKGYWALKLTGEDIDAPHMARARDWILAQGGAATANVFTRFSMALFGQVPWRAVPVMPVECMLLPRWFPFHLSKISYWSRTVLVPLLVLYAKRARAANPTGLSIRELFTVDPDEHRVYNVNSTGSGIGALFVRLDRGLRMIEPRLPKGARGRAIEAAEAFVVARLNGENGLGAIFPAMVNAVLMFHALGRPEDHPHMQSARQAVDNLMTERGDALYPQPCFSPVWDTGLAAYAMLEAGMRDRPEMTSALDWLAERQILDHSGDWAQSRPDLRPGGWAFQYDNPDYPDIDDTAVVVMAMHRADPERYAPGIARACEWLVGMQSKNGGWGAFDVDNTYHYLNAIPFADHGALLDPPTADVTARCVGCLAQVDAVRHHAEIDRGVGFLRRIQESDGSWFGRWGANYIYGTWSVLAALRAAGVDMGGADVRRAVGWLISRQHANGGWGEGLESYEPSADGLDTPSTASQTAWAVLGLVAAGETRSEAALAGVRWLENAPREGARWAEAHFTGTGFPRVFYLKYHSYSAIFPLFALARYQGMMAANDDDPGWGM